MSVGDHDRQSLELAKAVAAGLPGHPEWLDLARANLDRWQRLNSNSAGLVRCYREWRGLLSRSIHEICTALTSETDQGQRLRANSPFAGALPPAVVWDIKRRCHDDAIAA